MSCSCLVLSHLVLSRLVSSCLVLSCFVLSCLVLFRLVLSSIPFPLSPCCVLSCLVIFCVFLSCVVLFCLAFVTTTKIKKGNCQSLSFDCLAMALACVVPCTCLTTLTLTLNPKPNPNLNPPHLPFSFSTALPNIQRRRRGLHSRCEHERDICEWVGHRRQRYGIFCMALRQNETRQDTTKPSSMPASCLSRLLSLSPSHPNPDHNPNPNL